MRAMNDAILTGIGTVLSDDPALTCRLPGMAAQSPVRVVPDRGLRLPPLSIVARTAKQVPVWVSCAEDAPVERERALSDLGVIVQRTKTGEGGLDLHAVLQALGSRGITRLMVEAGPRLSAAFLRADLVDEAYLLRGPDSIGADGIDALDGLPLSALTGSTKLREIGSEQVGTDTHVHFERR
jgi:diaminohydroxyphosphoribosylaminopyrimidine deaminase/5-amino-6-(5-phosphoribosylamino)uracil reductase